jgi:hypothetical protein
MLLVRTLVVVGVLFTILSLLGGYIPFQAASLRDGGLTLLGLVIVLVPVWIAGPSERATAAREWMAPYVARVEIPFGAAAALLFLLVWWRPTVQTQRWQLILAAAVVLALGVEVLRRQTAREFGNPQTKGAVRVHDGK